MLGYKYAAQPQDPESQAIGAAGDEEAQDTSDSPAD